MVTRHILPIIETSLALFPAVLLNGARQVGKSTLAKQLVKEKKIDRYVSLDDITFLEAADKDPQGFIGQFSSSVVIDEVQRVPNLILATKESIDTKKIPGKFFFTGSANILSSPHVRDSLAGRMDIISLEGFSLDEIMQRKRSCLLDILLQTDDADHLVQTLSAQINMVPSIENNFLNELLFFGSYPDVILAKNPTHRNRWFSSYTSAYVERDVRDLSKFVDIIAFAKLLRIVAVRTGNLLNNKNLSISIGLDQRTVTRYIELLEMSFQITLLRPWSSNMGKRYVKTPKIFMNDVGMASYFLGINDLNSIRDHHNYGNLMETWLFSELRKSLVYNPLAEIFFYRDHRGIEVDFLITQGNKAIGIECKSSSSITMKDCKNLNFVKEEFKDNFLGIILYRGKEVIKMDSNIVAIPFEGLLC
jgi:predicted AAA+ superfamily ATPase